MLSWRISPGGVRHFIYVEDHFIYTPVLHVFAFCRRAFIWPGAQFIRADVLNCQPDRISGNILYEFSTGRFPLVGESRRRRGGKYITTKRIEIRKRYASFGIRSHFIKNTQVNHVGRVV